MMSNAATAITVSVAIWMSGMSSNVGAQVLDGRGRLGGTSADSARRALGTDLPPSDQSPEVGRGDGNFVVVGRGVAPAGRETPRYSDLEYGRLLRSLMGLGNTAPSTTPRSGTILPENFERDHLRSPGKASRPIRVKAVDVLDRGLIVMPTREIARLRGARIPSQFTGSDASRGAGREATRLLRDLTRSGDLYLAPGFPVRDSSGAILVDIKLEDGRTLSEFLITEGLAMTENGDFDSISADVVQQYNAVQSVARRNRLGLWGRR